MPIEIYTRQRGKNFALLANSSVFSMKHRLKEALDDISEEIKNNASRFAPISNPVDKAGGSARDIPSGTLKENPVDITHSRFGESTAVGASGFRFQAPAGAINAAGEKIGGQFIRGNKGVTGEAHIFYTINIEYPEYPFYAKFVAFGTKGHGPATAKRMKFYYDGKNYSAKWVSGQKANPWLTEAVDASKGYLEARLGQLRAEARLI